MIKLLVGSTSSVSFLYFSSRWVIMPTTVTVELFLGNLLPRNRGKKGSLLKA
jgi:hypothetical protein